MEVTISTQTQILTTDGVPLKVSLRKTERKNKIRAFLLVFPLLIYILITFVLPIADMLLRSVDDQHINTVFPITFAEYNKWDRQGLPPEAVYKAMYDELGSVIPNRVDTTGLKPAELKRKRSQEIGKSLTRMNYSKSGWKSLIKKTRKQILKNIKKGQLPES